MFGPFSNPIVSSWNPRFLPELPFCWLLSWPTVMCLRGSNGSTTICSVPLISALQKFFRVEGVKVQVSVSFGKTQINIAILILDEIFTCKMDSHLPRLQNPEKVWRVMKKSRGLNLPAKLWDRACREGDHKARSGCLCCSRRRFYTTAAGKQFKSWLWGFSLDITSLHLRFVISNPQ